MRWTVLLLAMAPATRPRPSARSPRVDAGTGRAVAPRNLRQHQRHSELPASALSGTLPQGARRARVRRRWTAAVRPGIRAGSPREGPRTILIGHLTVFEPDSPKSVKSARNRRRRRPALIGEGGTSSSSPPSGAPAAGRARDERDRGQDRTRVPAIRRLRRAALVAGRRGRTTRQFEDGPADPLRGTAAAAHLGS